MKKKVLAALLCASMTAGLFAGCGGKEEAADTPATESEAVSTETVAGTEEAEEPAAEPVAATMAEAEALPETAFAHITFDGEDEGYTTVTQTENVGCSDRP